MGHFNDSSFLFREQRWNISVVSAFDSILNDNMLVNITYTVENVEQN